MLVVYECAYEFCKRQVRTADATTLRRQQRRAVVASVVTLLLLAPQSLVQAAAKPAPSGTAARLELVSSPLEAEIRASLLRTAAEQVLIHLRRERLSRAEPRGRKPYQCAASIRMVAS